MADIETVQIYRIDTGEAVQTLNDLRQNIAALKNGWTDAAGEAQKGLNEMEIGSEEYNERVRELTASQNALKDAMWDQKAAGDGVAKSYNSLSAEMAKLKQQQKALDISTEEGKQAFSDMATQIKAINNELKDLDASNGVFTRNVGDYANQFKKGFGEVAANMPSWGESIRKPIDDISKSAGLMATNPILGFASLLLPLVMKITEGLKDNEQATQAVKKVMEALQPVFNIINNAIEKAVGWVAQMVSRLADLAGESTGTFKTIVTGAVGVGNALLQFILTPIRSVIEAAKGLGNVFKNVFSGQFKEAAVEAKAAAAGIADAFKRGFSFKDNFAAGQAVGEQFAQGLKSKRSKEAAAAAVKEVVEEAVAGITAGDIDKALAEADRKAEEARRRRAEERKEVNDMFAEDDAALLSELEGMWDDFDVHQEESAEKQKELMKQRMDAVNSAAGATSSILSSLADIYESSTDASEKETKRAKNLRIAAATIDMLQGAVTAFSTAMSLGPVAGPIVGAVNAAAVIAAGVANIAKIKATTVSKDSGSTATSSAPAVSATVSAPTTDYTQPEQVRTITSASEEQRLNRMADEQRVYILQSDIEAAGRTSKVQVAEATF